MSEKLTILDLECLVWNARNGGEVDVESAIMCTRFHVSLGKIETTANIVTDHIAQVVLSSSFLCNIALNAEKDNRIVLDCVFLVVKAANQEEALSIM